MPGVAALDQWDAASCSMCTQWRVTWLATSLSYFLARENPRKAPNNPGGSGGGSGGDPIVAPLKLNGRNGYQI